MLCFTKFCALYRALEVLNTFNWRTILSLKCYKEFLRISKKYLNFISYFVTFLWFSTQLKILGGAPEEYRGERWATGDYSGRIGEEAHSPICPLKLPDKIITGDLWWELLRGPQWSHRRLEGRNLRWAAIEIKRTFRRRPHGGPPVMRLSAPPLPTIFPLSAPDYFQ